MRKVYISIHDLSPEDYEKLGQVEHTGNLGSGEPIYWKWVDTPSSQVTYHKQKEPRE